jgi:hypothetical protein
MEIGAKQSTMPLGYCEGKLDMNETLQVFIGVDQRQPIALTAAAHSVVWKSSKPVAIRPLILSQLPIKRRGLTEFTFSRFLVPWLCGFKGKALFIDADMIVTGDIAELFEMGGMNAVSVMQDQEPFERPSMMLFNCGACLRLTPEFIDDQKNQLFDFAWAPYIGNLPKSWNQIVGYGPFDPRVSKLLHFTRGIPVWDETTDTGYDDLWLKELADANSTCDYKDLMGHSIHHDRAVAQDRRNIVVEGSD